MDVLNGNADNATLADWPMAKAYYFSGHDATIYALLHALGIGTDELPPYIATIILELHKDASDAYFIRVIASFVKNSITNL
jgi:hypothetical protein